MLVFKTPKQLYNSKEFRKLRQILIDEQLQKNGEVICNHCKQPVNNTWEIICHHITQVDMTNLNNPEITLNQNNLELICFDCHQREHKRFGYESLREVFLITGSVGAGKSTFAKQHATKDDIIIDLDSIWQMLSNNERYVKPDTLKAFVFNIYNECINQITIRTGKWNNAYVISSLPRVMDRRRMLEKLGATEVHIDTPKEECIRRITEDKTREYVKDEYIKYINDYWEKYQPDELIDD